MTFTEAIRSVFSQYAGFSGRAPRSEYWWWILFFYIVLIAAGIIDGAIVAPMLGQEAFAQGSTGPLSGLFILATLLPGIAVGVRRLHDLDKSGWWILISFIPLIGFIVLVYWFVHRGTDGANRFGEARILPRNAGA